MNTSLFHHYLTVALRSLQRYRLQSIISIVGLAVGFVCLSLSALWLRYDNTYNMHLPIDAPERTYALGGSWRSGEFTLTVPGGLREDMNEWPEVEAWCLNQQSTVDLEIDGVKEEVAFIDIDKSFAAFFHFDVIAGPADFWTTNKGDDMYHLAFSESYARKKFGQENPVGRKVKIEGGAEAVIEAVVKDFSRHSSFTFDLAYIMPNDGTNDSRGSWQPTLVRLAPGDDVKASFEKKIQEHVEWEGNEPIHGRIVPLNKMGRWKDNAKLSYAHMRAFLLISILLTVCALINFLTLYLTRLRGRKREMALRLVNGSSHRGLVSMFATELLVTLGSATLLGVLLVFGLRDVFASFAGIEVGGGYVTVGAFVIMLGVLSVCLMLSLGAVEIVRRRTLQSSINPAAARRHVFSSVSIGVQLAVSLCFVFCAVVMLRQLWFMRHTDNGVTMEDRAYLTIGPADHLNYNMKHHIDDNGIPERLAALPAINLVSRDWNFWMYSMSSRGYEVSLSEDPESEFVEVSNYRGIFDPGNPIYGFTVVEGELPRYDTWNPSEIVIDEQTRDRLGLAGGAVGKTIWYRGYGDKSKKVATIGAVVRNVTIRGARRDSRIFPVFIYRVSEEERNNFRSHCQFVQFAYRHGMKKEMEAQVAELMDGFPELRWELKYADEMMKEMTESDQNLGHLLLLVTLVAIMIAVFGVYSIITLACRQRRKEIALRKVHGAKRKDILGMFVREYGIILVVSSAIAFVVGYLIMHGWLEQYVRRITVGPVFYLGIFVATALLIAFSVGSRVWRTARENPADVIKSE